MAEGGDNVLGRVRFYFISQEQLARLRAAVRPRLLGSERQIHQVLATLPTAPRAYDHSSHFFAFLVAYLEESHHLPLAEPALSQRLNDEHPGVFDLFEPNDATWSVLTSEIDEEELLAEFHGAGPHRPETLPALRAAVLGLRENLKAVPAGDLLLWRG
jgi:hypothetical protein